MPIRIETISQYEHDLCFSEAMECAKRELSVGVPIAMNWTATTGHLDVFTVATQFELDDDAALAKGLELSAAGVAFTMARIGRTKDERIAELEADNARQERRLRSLMNRLPKPTKPTKKVRVRR